ncbi:MULTISPECIES: VRR-NUC domain-containing protein [Corynebacterium]|uniref:VRR-NUC domain-containing protein n=1 Tax=Corynebacterium TaxID=1716 RepID=UPI0003B8B84E|nr:MULTISPECIES: VRR-NUC domain-containing protein [Corynebacterium]ERS41843.1 hypothetical protein HMPREF1293_01994 [Corynebacterium sp. KPL1996]ERS44672.1 hypothetical protein HMPREF1287_01165 [Corynebacterium sp. KPL1986]ERS72597.1 hypothetical protein HMPREF1295_01524 [Corynebacterium sp. KPL1998]ERS73944.1 hypothetical protein HMPREF1300_00927 [Corynebacterium sp. KPL2004]MCT1410027.1 VRR-NUC domain-containing protein [Corynebacterium accolens]
MNEKHIEQALINATKQRGGKALKFTSPGWSGAPDRLIILRGGKTGFVELKAPGKKPRPLQQQRLTWLQNMGHYATWCDNPHDIPRILDEIQTT